MTKQTVSSADYRPTTNSVAAPSDRASEEEYNKRTNDHLDSLTEFVETFRKVIPNILAEQQKYDRVKALLFHWERGEPDMSEGAIELERVFKEVYGYEAERWPIPMKRPTNSFISFLSGQIEELQKEGKDSLLIIYYGGHGIWNKKDNTHLWKPVERVKSKETDVSLKMTLPRESLCEAECDILLIFDCCFSLAMMGDDFKGQRRVWLLAAAGNVEKAGAAMGASYTNAIAKELEAMGPSGGISVVQLHRLLLRYEKSVETYHLVTTPQIQRYSSASYLGSISIAGRQNAKLTDRGTKAPLQESERTDYDLIVESQGAASANPMERLRTDARMLIKIAFTNHAEQLRHDLWEYWFKNRPPNFTEIEIAVWKQVEVVGFFPSNSSMLLITIPVGLWAFFPQHPAFECLGIVRSRYMMTLDGSGPLRITDHSGKSPSDLAQELTTARNFESQDIGKTPLPLRDSHSERRLSRAQVPLLPRQPERMPMYPFWSRITSREEIAGLIVGRLKPKRMPYDKDMEFSEFKAMGSRLTV